MDAALEMKSLFSYGSLREPEVQRKIIGRLVKGTSDVIDGYTTSTIRLYGNTYPILKPDVNSSIKGVILEVTPEELEKIDEYETKAYQRIKVILRSGKEAWVYQKPEVLN